MNHSTAGLYLCCIFIQLFFMYYGLRLDFSRFLLLFAFFFIGVSAVLAESSLKGKVVDAETSEPLEFAAISLFDASGERLITGVLADIEGNFEITGVEQGTEYLLVVNFLGYAVFDKLVHVPHDRESVDLGLITMQSDAAVIEQVEVTGVRSAVQMNIDRRVFNVEQDISARGGSGLDVMRNVPGIMVDADGEVTLRNASVQILVNGRPTPLELEQIPADQIQSVEVITNPSARFDASATGGIVNIILKENRRDNINGTINAGVGLPERYSAGINVGSRFGRFNTMLNYNFGYTTSVPDGKTLRNVLNEEREVVNYYNQYQDRFRANENHSIRLATEWQATPRDLLSVSGMYSTNNRREDETIDYESGTPGSPLFAGTRQLDEQRTRSGFALQSMYYRTFAGEGRNLTADLSYQQFTTEGTDKYVYHQFDMEGNPWPDFPYWQMVNTGISNSRIDFQLDYVHPVNERMQVEAGVRSYYNYQLVENLVRIQPFGEADFEVDPFLSEDYRIDEMIHAAYGIFSNKIAPWQYQLGLRFEYSDYRGDILDTESSFSYRYPSGTFDSFLKAFFPSFYLTRTLSPGQTLQFSVSRKINRPGRWQLMPNVTFRDNQNIRIGNPSINPEFMNIAELGYQNIFDKGNFVTSVYGRYISDPFTWINVPYEQDSSILVFTPINGVRRINYGWENIFRYDIIKNLEFTLSTHFYYAILDAEIDGSVVRTAGWAAVVNPMIRYQLPWNLALQVSGSYRSPRILPQGRTKDFYFADAALSKQIGRQWNISLIFSDMLNSRYWGSITETGTIYQESERRHDGRNVRLNVSYRFGVEDQRQRQRRGRTPSMGGNGDDMMEM